MVLLLRSRAGRESPGRHGPDLATLGVTAGVNIGCFPTSLGPYQTILAPLSAPGVAHPCYVGWSLGPGRGPSSVCGRLGGTLGGHDAAELGARANAQFRICAREVRLNRLGAYKQPLRDLSVRQALGGQECKSGRIRLKAQDTALSRRRSPVRIRYAVPNPRMETS